MAESNELAPVVVEMRALPEFTVTETTAEGIWEQHVTTWRAVDTSMQAHHFMLGSIADSLTRRYGERTVQRFAHEVRVSAQTIYERAATYRAWKGKEINPEMFYSAHINAAVLSRVTGEEPEVILARFEDEKLSYRQQKELISAAKNQPVEPYQGSSEYVVPTPALSKRTENWLEHIRSLPCVRCDKRGKTEPAHFKGVFSDKTGERHTRRGGSSMWVALPLCAGCHREDRDSLHMTSEASFLEQFGGYEWAQAWVINELVDWLERWD